MAMPNQDARPIHACSRLRGIDVYIDSRFDRSHACMHDAREPMSMRVVNC